MNSVAFWKTSTKEKSLMLFFLCVIFFYHSTLQFLNNYLEHRIYTWYLQKKKKIIINWLKTGLRNRLVVLLMLYKLILLSRFIYAWLSNFCISFLLFLALSLSLSLSHICSPYTYQEKVKGYPKNSIGLGNIFRNILWQ